MKQPARPRKMFGPRPEKWFVGDGCTFSPDGFYGLDWSEACRWHDWCYRQDVQITRVWADLYFMCNLVVCGCPLRWAFWYFLAVRVCGWRHWNRKATTDEPNFMKGL